MVNTLGLPMSVRSHPANIHDSVGAEVVFGSLRYKFPGLKRILADGQICPLAKRWIVERTFFWLENFRRQTIDYEYRADTHEAMMQIAAIRLFLNKL